jgi:transcriptional regulator with XRE-family HTH domain
VSDKTAVINYIAKKYFDGDAKKLATATGYSVASIKQWLEGLKTPRESTVEYIMHCAFTPEHRIICEYEAIEPSITLSGIKKILGDGANSTGIYAFYDSMARLSYVGKAARPLSEEICSALKRKHVIKLPNGIKDKIIPRTHVVHYISAYEVMVFEQWDYARHVESLILRISKPPMNKISGNLEKAFSKPLEDD